MVKLKLPEDKEFNIGTENKINFTTVKIAQPTYDFTKQLQAEIARQGIQNISGSVANLLSNNYCPFDYKKLESLQGSWVKCPQCNYAQQKIEIRTAKAEEVFATIAISGLIALGIIALAKMMKDK